MQAAAAASSSSSSSHHYSFLGAPPPGTAAAVVIDHSNGGAMAVLQRFLLVVVTLLLPTQGVGGEANGAAVVVSHLSKLSAARLASVLDPVQLCLVASSRGNVSSTSYQALHSECLGRLGLGAAVHEHAFLRLNQSAFPRYESKRSHCCIEDLPLAERQLDEAVAEAFDSVPADVALRLLQTLSLRNMSLVLAGDSMNAQLHSALLHEIRRQGALLRRFEFSARLLSLGASRKTTTHGYHRWDPPPARGPGEKVMSNPVFIYVLDMWYGHQRSAQEQDLCLRFLPALLADHQPTGVLLLANIGLHLEVERNAFVRQGSTEPMVQSIADFLAWLRHLASRHSSSIFAFRETTPTHFSSPDGSYEAWHHRAPAEKNSMAPGYRCRPSSNISSLENRVAADIIANTPNASSRLGLLRVHDVLAPFYAMHYGNCAHEGRISTLDCVHYCAFLPQMFLPIWHNVWRLVSSAPADPQNPSDAPNLPFLPPYTTHGAMFRRTSDDALVVCYNGICRVAASLQAVADELGMVFSRADIRPAAPGALQQPFGRPIPTTPPHPEGSVVRLHLSKQLFLVVANGTRRALPSWEAYQALPGRSAKAGVITLPLHALLRLTDGPPMPEPTHA